MLKCPMPGCGVVVAPERGVEHLSEQKGALMRHLQGDESGWWRCKGHKIKDPVLAREIADHVEKIAELIAQIPQEPEGQVSP